MIGDGSPREHPMVWVRRTKQVKELPVMCPTPRLPVQYNRHASGAKELAVACSTLRLLLIQYNRHPSGLSVVQLWQGTILDSGIKSSEERLRHR